MRNISALVILMLACLFGCIFASISNGHRSDNAPPLQNLRVPIGSAASKQQEKRTLDALDNLGGHDHTDEVKHDKSHSAPTCWIITESEDDSHIGHYLESDMGKAHLHDAEEQKDEFDINHFQKVFSPSGKKVELREKCWDGFDLEIIPPKDNIVRVNQFYNFTIRARVRQVGNVGKNVTNSTDNVLDGLIFPTNHIYFRMILCDVSKTSFCTPYTSTNTVNNHHDHGIQNDREHKEDNHGAFEGEGHNDDGNSHEEHEASAVRFTIPPPEADKDHVSTSYHISEITPSVDTYTDSNGITNVMVDNITINSYHDQTVDLVMSLNVESENAGKPRTFLVIGHVIFFTSSFDDHTHISKRIDMASSVPGSLLTYQDPEIQSNSKACIITLGIVLAFLVAAEVFLFLSTMFHRNSQVMKLSQAPLLALLVLAAAVATGSCFLLMPLNDIFCIVRDPLTMIPVTLVGCIIVARIWRINTLLAPSLRMGRGSQHSQTSKLIELQIMGALSFVSNGGLLFFKRSSAQRRRSLRQVVRLPQVMFLVAALILPQLIIQVCLVSIPVLRAQRVEQLIDSWAIGRYTCSREIEWPIAIAYTFALIPYLLALFLAYCTRELPSLFDESAQIYACAKITNLLFLVEVPLLIITSTPSNSPNVTVFLETAIILTTVLIPCWFLVLERLRKVWSGKKVVVSRLLMSREAEDSPPASMEKKPRNSLDEIQQLGCSYNVKNKSKVSFRGEPNASGKLTSSNEDKGVDVDNAKDKDELQRIALTAGLIVEISKPLPSKLEKSILAMKCLVTSISTQSLTGVQLSRQELETLKSEAKQFGQLCGEISIISETEEI